jgi:hypothetical protein
MLTAAEIHAIFTRPEAAWRINSESPLTHTFAHGYEMMSTLTSKGVKEELHLVIHEDGIGEIQTFTVAQLPELTEEHVKHLGRCGFSLCSETGRIAYKIVAKTRRTT